MYLPLSRQIPRISRIISLRPEQRSSTDDATMRDSSSENIVGYGFCQTVLVPLPAVLRLVLRSLPRRPRDHALAGAGSPGLRATRGRPSGELAVLGPLSWPREVALTVAVLLSSRRIRPVSKP